MREVLDSDVVDDRPDGTRDTSAFTKQLLLDVPGLGECILRDVLGTGGHAQVFGLQCIGTGERYALKAMKGRSTDVSEPELDMCRTLVQLQGRIAARRMKWNKHVVRTVRVSQPGETLDFASHDVEERVLRSLSPGGIHWNLPAGTIITEHVAKGELFTYFNEGMRERRLFSEELIWTLAAQLLSALEFMTDTLELSHRDLKLENLAIDGDGALKVLDFGLCVSPATRNRGHGTALYQPPEREHSAQDVDVWACGVVLHLLYAGPCVLPRGPFCAAEHDACSSDPMKAALGLMLRAAVPRPTFSQLRREPCFRDAPMLDGAEVAAELRTLWPEPWADGGGGHS